MYRQYWITLLVLAVLSPLGLIADGTAWGEWEVDKIEETVGFVPQGMQALSELWHGIFPDYTVRFLGESTVGQAGGYIFSALIGSAMIYAVTTFAGRLLSQKNKSAILSK